MKKYTFTLNNNPSTYTCPFYKSTDYSKVLDDLIAADIKKNNPWLYNDNYTPTKKIKIKINTTPTISEDLEKTFIFGKKYNDYSKACKFLSNFSKFSPFKKNKTYKLSSGDYIEITDDYIHINDEMFFFNLMDDTFFYNLDDKMKDIICVIYTDGAKITIKN